MVLIFLTRVYSGQQTSIKMEPLLVFQDSGTHDAMRERVWPIEGVTYRLTAWSIWSAYCE